MAETESNTAAKPTSTYTAGMNLAAPGVHSLFCNIARARSHEIFEFCEFPAERVIAINFQAAQLQERAQWGIDAISECLAVALASKELDNNTGAQVAWTLQLLQELATAAGIIIEEAETFDVTTVASAPAAPKFQET